MLPSRTLHAAALLATALSLFQQPTVVVASGVVVDAPAQADLDLDALDDGHQQRRNLRKDRSSTTTQKCGPGKNKVVSSCRHLSFVPFCSTTDFSRTSCQLFLTTNNMLVFVSALPYSSSNSATNSSTHHFSSTYSSTNYCSASIPHRPWSLLD